MTTLGRQLDLRPPDARRDHLHIVAVLYIGATVLLLLGAMSSQNNLLFAAVGLSLATVIVSGFVAGSSMMGLRFARRVPVIAEAGAPVRVAYLVHNRNKLVPAFAIRVHDTARGPAGATMPVRTGIDRVPARGERSVHATATFPTRGRWSLGPGRLITMFPFGISKKSMRFDTGESLLVSPARKNLKPGVLGNLESASEEGRTDPRRRGQGTELYALRDYRLGDPVSAIAWKPSARHARLITRETAAPRARRVWIVIEASAEDLRQRRPGAEACVRLAHAAGRRLHELGIASGLRVPSYGLNIPPQFTGGAEPAWLPALATLGDDPKPASARAHASQDDGILAIGPGTTPGATLTLDPAREDQLTTDPRTHLRPRSPSAGGAP